MPSDQVAIAVTAERDRRWLRRSFWTGCLLALATALFVYGQPVYVRRQLEQHGWEVGPRSFNETWMQGWRRQYLSRWIDPIEDLWLENQPIQPRDLELMRYLPTVKQISLQSTNVEEQAAIRFSQFSRLEDLSFWNVTIDDSCIPILANCRSLRALRFGEMPVNDESLIHLQKLGRLTKLELHETGSKGFQHVANCSNLESLEIYEGHFTDADLTSLSRLTKLRRLTLYDCPVTDEGAKTLADACRGLTELDLRGDRLTDAAMAHLARLPDLEYLILDDQPITDAGLREFKTCAALGRLVVQSTNVTSSGVDDLKRAKPKLRVSR